MENEKNFIENKPRIFTKEEVLATIGNFAKGAVFVDEKSDEKGLCWMSVKVVEEKLNETTEIQYRREGMVDKNGKTESETYLFALRYIDGMYEKGGDPISGEIIAFANTETGELELLQPRVVAPAEEVFGVKGNENKKEITPLLPGQKIPLNQRVEDLLRKKSVKEMSVEEYGEFLEWVAFDWLHDREFIELRDTVIEVADFEKRIASFESTHSLEALHAITDLKVKDAPNHPVREPARKALIPIVVQLNILELHKNQGKISTEQHEKLRLEYMRLSRAVGMINNNKVDHTRS